MDGHLGRQVAKRRVEQSRRKLFEVLRRGRATTLAFMRPFFALLTFVFVSLIGGNTFLRADVGSENVLLVVNPKSQSSLSIANHYARLRQIPDDRIIFLPWDPKQETTDIDTFRKQILSPLMQAIQRRRGFCPIDVVIYSSDFPWGVKLDSDIRKFTEKMRAASEASPGKPHDATAQDAANADKSKKSPWPYYYTPVGSLTGLTYLWQPVLMNTPAYFELNGNYFMRQANLSSAAATQGFRSSLQFNSKGEIASFGGRAYMLAAMLGVTAGRGTSTAETLAYLTRSATADGTHPKGTIYFVKNSDVRSTVRDKIFPTAVAELRKLGVAAEELEGTLPKNKNDVQGVVVGAATFDWKSSGSVILPGAFCEHFTSFGGAMNAGAPQTPLTEFLRNGAAGATGTVCEPYAIAQKFPSPMVQVHYARGCTLVEALYQSVHCPYQLLLVGDPLCRPWADIPRVAVEGVKSGDKISGQLSVRPSAVSAKDGKTTAIIERFELFFDGMLAARCKPGEALSLNTTKSPDGFHELRIVAVGPRPLETQGRLIVPVWLANHNRTINASPAGKGPWSANKPIAISVRSPGAKAIVAFHGERSVGRVMGEQGQIEIPADTLGAGPVRIRVVGIGDGGPPTNVMAEPVELQLE